MTIASHHLDTIPPYGRRRAMRSLSGLMSGIAVLSALPLAFLTVAAFGAGDGITVHIALGTGMLLLILSTFDFRMPEWLALVGRTGMIVLGTIFFLQAAAEIAQAPELLDLAYRNVFVQWIEKLSAYPILIWFAGLWVVQARSVNRALGGLALAAILASELYSFWLVVNGRTPDSLLHALFLLLFAWLSIEGGKRRS